MTPCPKCGVRRLGVVGDRGSVLIDVLVIGSVFVLGWAALCVAGGW